MSDSSPTPLTALKCGSLSGRLRVPGDKSISHRALILGALSVGKTRISGLLEAEDVLNTARVVQALGAEVKRVGADWEVIGRGVGGLQQPDAPLDFGNSGTGVRLMMGVVAGHQMVAELIGDASLSKRPMGRVLRPLVEMGLAVDEDEDQACVQASGGSRTLPLKLRGMVDLIPITYELPVPSAQVKSAVLLAGLHAAGTTTVVESQPTRDHTERMFRYFGAKISSETRNGKTEIVLSGRPELVGKDVVVGSDPSSAAIVAAAAAIVLGSDVMITGVLINPTRVGFYRTLRDMGADVAFENEREQSGEPIADIRVRACALSGVTVPAERAPSMIDEYPVLAVVAAFAEGKTVMEGLSELRVKESDRLSATAAGLMENGVQAEVVDDTLIVFGRRKPNEAFGCVPGGGTVATHLDHRIAMAFLTLGLASTDPVTVDDTSMIATSFPQFQTLMESLGGRFTDRSNSVSGAGAEGTQSSQKRSIVIAIDGPAASGKGTLARRIAAHYGLRYLDTGSLYRAVARDSIKKGVDLADAAAVAIVARDLDPASLDDRGLRSPGIGEAASRVAGIAEVRAALLEYQRAFANQYPGAVLDGRDIGTVVCPDADAKLFVDATAHVRATRRHLERVKAGEKISFDAVLDLIKERDERDSNRAASPMRVSRAADLLDTTDLDIEQAFETAVGLIKRKIGQ